MDAKEKAQELVQKLHQQLDWIDTHQNLWEAAQSCATVAIDEILQQQLPFASINSYWQEVRGEIFNTKEP